MTVFYLTLRNVIRTDGRSSVGAAAYCSRSRLYDERSGHEYDFRAGKELAHAEILLPEGAPDRWRDRVVFWNEVEASKEGENIATAREIEAVIPGELCVEAGVSVLREFVFGEFSAWGKVVDVSLHRSLGADGRSRLYGHILSPLGWLTPDGPDGMGQKREPWIGGRVVKEWRDHWAKSVNRQLMQGGVGAAIGTKVGECRGRCLELDVPVNGAAAVELRWRNGERIMAEPGLALEQLLQGRVSFTRRELEALVWELTVGEKQYSEALFRVESLPGITRLGMADSGEEMFGVRASVREAFQQVCGGGAWLAVPQEYGVASAAPKTGDGYSALRAAVGDWGKAGLRARGVGVTYERAKRFERATKIHTVGIHGILGRWKKKTDLLESTDVLVVNDAAELSDAQKEWMLKAVRRQKAKLVLVSDWEFVVIDGADMGLDARQTAAMVWGWGLGADDGAIADRA